MDPEMMQQSASMVSFFGEYGAYGILAVLAMVIVHLYRQVSNLSKETLDIIAKYAEESARAQAQLLAAIQRSDDVIERNTEALRRIATLDQLDQNMSR